LLNRENLLAAAVFCFLLVLGVMGRLGSYWFGAWNFTPVAAVGLFAGYYFRSRAVALFVPLAVMVLSNLVIGSYLSRGMELAVYAAMLLPVLLSGVLRRKLSALRVGGCAVASSVLFFVITNSSHWWFMRQHSAAELLQSYVEALPFFRATILGDLFWSGVIFGAYALATWTDYVPRRYARARVRKQ
jgi:hypothetical protein